MRQKTSLLDINTVTVLRGCENLQLTGDEPAFYFLTRFILRRKVKSIVFNLVFMHI